MTHSPTLPPLIDIIQSTTEPIITVDAAHRIVMFNPAAEKVFLYAAEQVTGRDLGILVPARFRKAHARHIARFRNAGASKHGARLGAPLWGLKANGEEFPMEASISRIGTPTDVYLSVFLRDMTEQQQIEQALRASRDELTRLSNALLREREQEKRHIARELHDDIGQCLTTLSMELSQLETTMHPLTVAGSGHVDAMRHLIKSAFTSLRRIASDLRPIMLDDLGLPAAVEWLMADFSARYGMDVKTRIDIGQHALSTVMGTVLFRVAQEALTNLFGDALCPGRPGQRDWLDARASGQSIAQTPGADGHARTRAPVERHRVDSYPPERGIATGGARASGAAAAAFVGKNHDFAFARG